MWSADVILEAQALPEGLSILSLFSLLSGESLNQDIASIVALVPAG